MVKVKDKLKAAGYKVWMDLDNMSKSVTVRSDPHLFSINYARKKNKTNKHQHEFQQISCFWGIYCIIYSSIVP